jgi:tRNA modification GTPase
MHNSYSVITSTLATLADLNYLRPADPGEFTSLAFANGKMSLLDVESLSSLLTAVTTEQRVLALQSSEASFRLYEGYARVLLKALAHAEAIVDFSDDTENDIELALASNWSTVVPGIKALIESMQAHLSTSHIPVLLDAGVRVSLYGAPNVGKSSLLNALTATETSIVSSIPGTTRDAVTATVDLNGYKVTLVDTAGIRETADVVENMGIERTWKEIGKSDVKVLVTTSSGSDDEREAFQDVDPDIVLVNKIDEHRPPQQSDPAHKPNHVYISCKTNEGMPNLVKRIADVIKSKVDAGINPSTGEENVVVTQTRHANHVRSAVACLERFLERVDEGAYADDLAAEELRKANTEIARIMGKVDVEQVLDVLFRDFCVGK